MTSVLQDVRYAARQLRRTSGFTCAAVLTLAIGVAANSSLLAIANALIASLMPSGNFDRVYLLQVTEPTRQVVSTRALTLPVVHKIEKDLPPSVDSVAAVGWEETATVTGQGYAESLLVEPVTSGYQRVFELRTQAGRWFDRAEDTPPAAAHVAVISDRIWREWFHADPGVAAHVTIRINQLHFAVIGVAAPSFGGVIPGVTRADVWIPSAAVGDLYPLRQRASPDWQNQMLATVFVKPRQGATAAELRTRLHPYVVEGWDGRHVPAALSIVPAMNTLAAPFIRARLIAVAFATLVLLAACANFGNMLLARGAEREGELAVRTSLGAKPFRIFRLLVTESALIGLAAAAIGLLIALIATSAFARAFPTIATSRAARLAFGLTTDARIALFALTAGVGAALLVGTVAAIRAVRLAPLRVMAASGTPGVTSRGRTRTAFIAVQVTAALILVMGAGLFLENQPTGIDLDKRVHYDAAHLLAARMDLSLSGYTPARAEAVFDRVLKAASTIPGVERAALADGIPGAVGDALPAVTPLIAQGPPNRPPSGNPRRVRATSAAGSPSLLDTLGIPLRRGRTFTQWDADGAPLVAIVSESTAQALYPHGDALGLSVQYGFGGPWLTIVGICADSIDGASDFGVYDRPGNAIFVPAAQHFNPKTQIVLRSSNPASIVEPLRNVMRSVDDGVPMYRPSTLEEGYLDWWAGVRAADLEVTMLGLSALVIAMLGIYGVVSYFVSSRTREFGIRLALGARRRNILTLVIDQAVHVLLIGLLCGVTVATTASRVIEQTVTRTMPNQLTTWIVVPILFIVTGVIAAYLPARRAARVDPNVALRHL